MSEARHNGVAASLRRMRLIAMHTLGEALRMRLAVLLGLTGALLVVGARCLREFNFGTAELKFVADFGLGVIGFLGMLLAALATAQLFFDNINRGEMACVLTRPVRRWEYIWGHFAGMAAMLAIFLAALALVLGGVIALREVQLGASFVPLAVFLQACALVWLKCTLVAAMTLLVCSYAGTALFASCAGLLLAVVAHLRPFADGGAALAWVRVWPNLTLFGTDTLLATGHAPDGRWLLGLAGYWAAYLLLLGGLASHAFTHREF